MDANAGSFVAVRRLAGSERAAGAAAFHHSSSGTLLLLLLPPFSDLAVSMPELWPVVARKLTMVLCCCCCCCCFARARRCSGGRDGVDGVDREGAVLRVRPEEGQRRAPLLRFDASSGDDGFSLLCDLIPTVLLPWC